MSANVTVLTDELGLDREYREVNRKARVGERIKITAEEMLGEHRKGEIYTVTSAADVDPVLTDGKWDDGSTLNLWHEDYVVLEPTDIVRIDGERFRVVERKANVGERVVIVGNTTNHCFSLGSTTLIQQQGKSGRVRGEDDRNGWLEHDNYRVLVLVQALAHEPLGSASEHSDVAELVRKSHEQQAQIDGLTETVANLARRLSKAESALYNVDLDVGLIEDGVGEDIRKLKERVAELERGQAPKEAPEPVVEKTSTRDQIIDKAKADVAELLSQNHPQAPTSGGVWFTEEGGWFDITDRCEFVIDRKKRTVVALIRDIEECDRVVLRGIAKCAPTDCFNVHIGQAIALRRALGLDIPQEYVCAPQPDEPRVGDVVEVLVGCIKGERMTLTERIQKHDSGWLGVAFRHTYDCGWLGSKQLRVIDDSRDGRYGEVYSA